jgi:hypothetical protein
MLNIGCARWLSVCMLVAAALPGASEIERGFADPPAESRMATYLWSFGPAWTREELRRHFELLREAGIGRVLLYPLYPYEVNDPKRGIRNLEYLSPEFLEMLRYAVTTARELGMETDLVMGTGWPYGGPMIPDSLSPKRIVMSSAPITAGAGAQAAMAVAPPHPRSELVAVQLVPETPGAGEPADLTARVRSGQVSFSAPAGKWLLMSFWQSPTDHRNKVIYAAAGAGGNVIDHLDRRAVDLYLKEIGAKLAGAAKGNLRALYCPSMEVDGTSWTPAFAAEFRKRRGYEIVPHLPALFRDEGEKSLHIRRDFWHTVQELAIDNYLRPVGDWIRSQGFRFQAESYGTPPVRLNSFGAVDYPMGEDEDWKQFNRTRWASAAAHFYRQSIVSVEAYTWLQPARYTESLQDVKIGTDLHFVAGANRIVMHGYGYSPKVVDAPGWGYFAGLMATEHNTWWPYFAHLSRYVHRTGYVLSQGVPVIDVALYLPEDDVFADTPPGYLNYIHVKYRLDRNKRRMGDNFGLPNAMAHETDVVKTIITNGYSLDGIDHSILPSMATVENGRLRVGHGSYAAVVLPGLRGLPLEDLEKAAAFCRAGGTVIATLSVPEMAYGYRGREKNAVRFRALAKELFGGMDTAGGYAEKVVGKGKAIFSGDEKDTLARALRAAVPPDVSWEPAADDIGFVHRRAGAQDFYFLASFRDAARRVRVRFRSGRRTPRLWDPMTGRIAPASYEYQDGGAVVDLELGPYGSAIVEFGEAKEPPRRIPPPREAGAPIPVRGPWRITWDQAGTSPVETPELKSWTEYQQVRYFSGKAAYETSVEVPAAALASGARMVLDLGRVHEIADVRVNGARAGVAWMLPRELDITAHLKPGRNLLRIEVSNLLINRVLSQPAKDYSDVERNYQVGNRMPRPREKDLVKEPLPSGLLGPVAIRQVTR